MNGTERVKTAQSSGVELQWRRVGAYLANLDPVLSFLLWFILGHLHEKITSGHHTDVLRPQASIIAEVIYVMIAS